MPYSTSADILLILDSDTLIQLTNDAGGTTVVESVVTRAIADADEEIDAYLSVRYSLPVSPTPGIVRKLSAQIAIYHLHARKNKIPETYRDLYNNAIRLLDKLAKGQVKLDVPEPTTASTDGAQVSTSESDRVFTRGKTSDGSSGSLDNY